MGTTILITEHRLEDIYHAADRVVVMDQGQILTDGTPRQVCDFLQRREHEMFAAMPAPVQVYYGIDVGTAENCPLTVREGRSFLSGFFAGRDPESLAQEIEVSDRHKSEGELENSPLSIVMKEVWFRYEKDTPDVLRGVDLEIPQGSIFAVVGGNGTGKSTMLKSICGVCRPYRGKIWIEGKRLDKYKGGELFAGTLAMLPQDPKSVFVKKTVREELLEMCDGRAANGAADRSAASEEEQILKIAELCEIDDLLDRHPYDLSGGEQQRTALAKVMLTKPKILLLDEPTKGMDSFFKQKFARVLKRLQTEGVTVVMVSHDVEFCARYADLTGMFFDGSIVTVNTPEKFFARNSFYTTAANRMSRHIFQNAVNVEDVIDLCRKNR